MEINEVDSKRIITLRFILMVGIFFIHANLTSNDAINYYHLDFQQPSWVEIIKNFLCGTWACSSVPLFFLFASFLQFSKDDNYYILLRKRFKSVLCPYLIWTILVILVYFVAQKIPLLSSFFSSNDKIIKDWSVFDYIRAFSYFDVSTSLKYPIVIQFWFLRELIIYIILSPLIKFLCTKFPGSCFLCIFLAAFYNLNLYFTVSSTAFFYYVLGFYFSKFKISFFDLADRISIFEYLFVLLGYESCSLIIPNFIENTFLITIISSLFLLKISAYLIENNSIFNVLKYLSSYSFFIYAVHSPFIEPVLNKISWKFIPLRGVGCFLQFLFVVIGTILFSTIIGIILKKLFPKLFNLLNGGR